MAGGRWQVTCGRWEVTPGGAPTPRRRGDRPPGAGSPPRSSPGSASPPRWSRTCGGGGGGGGGGGAGAAGGAVGAGARGGGGVAHLCHDVLPGRACLRVLGNKINKMNKYFQQIPGRWRSRRSGSARGGARGSAPPPPGRRRAAPAPAPPGPGGR